MASTTTAHSHVNRYFSLTRYEFQEALDSLQAIAEYSIDDILNVSSLHLKEQMELMRLIGAAQAGLLSKDSKHHFTNLSQFIFSRAYVLHPFIPDVNSAVNAYELTSNWSGSDPEKYWSIKGLIEDRPSLCLQLCLMESLANRQSSVLDKFRQMSYTLMATSYAYYGKTDYKSMMKQTLITIIDGYLRMLHDDYPIETADESIESKITAYLSSNLKKKAGDYADKFNFDFD